MNNMHVKKILSSSSAKKGFTLLLAALVSSVVLSIGAAVYAISFKQVQLSSVGRDSQFAFYAADTAAECGLFWDFRSDLRGGITFATSSASNNSNSLTTVTCNGQTVNVYVIASAAAAATSTFYYSPAFDATHGHCAEVTVTKYYNSTSRGINTTMHADGYSTVVSGTPAQQALSCTPSSVSGDPAPIPAAVAADNVSLQRTVELKY